MSRINQFIAASTNLSRRAADAAVAAGRVSVNGIPAALGQTTMPEDEITLDGSVITPRRLHTYLTLHKPVGYVSSRVRQGNDPTLYELLPPPYHVLRIAGRLDRDSSGLIVLSDDGEFIQDLPKAHKTKIYEITLESPFSASDRQKLEAGVPLTDGPSVAQVLAVNGKWLQVSLSEGRNRQLRRTFGALGYTIRRLHRTRMGTFELGDLAPGQWAITSPAGDRL